MKSAKKVEIAESIPFEISVNMGKSHQEKSLKKPIKVKKSKEPGIKKSLQMLSKEINKTPNMHNRMF
jgi:hypothetical protein